MCALDQDVEVQTSSTGLLGVCPLVHHRDARRDPFCLMHMLHERFAAAESSLEASIWSLTPARQMLSTQCTVASQANILKCLLRTSRFALVGHVIPGTIKVFVGRQLNEGAAMLLIAVVANNKNNDHW